MNGLINVDLIMKVWKFLRENEFSIPNETLDFMRDSAIEKLYRIEGKPSIPPCSHPKVIKEIISNSFPYTHSATISRCAICGKELSYSDQMELLKRKEK